MGAWPGRACEVICPSVPARRRLSPSGHGWKERLLSRMAKTAGGQNSAAVDKGAELTALMIESPRSAGRATIGAPRFPPANPWFPALCGDTMRSTVGSRFRSGRAGSEPVAQLGSLWHCDLPPAHSLTCTLPCALPASERDDPRLPFRSGIQLRARVLSDPGHPLGVQRRSDGSRTGEDSHR
jgi:hypothetical protein